MNNRIYNNDFNLGPDWDLIYSDNKIDVYDRDPDGPNYDYMIRYGSKDWDFIVLPNIYIEG